MYVYVIIQASICLLHRYTGDDTEIEVIIRDCVPKSNVGSLDASRCYGINDYLSDSELEVGQEDVTRQATSC